MKILYSKLLKVVTNFDQFLVDDGTFYSTRLIKRMEQYGVKKYKSLENIRKGSSDKALTINNNNSSEEVANRVE